MHGLLDAAESGGHLFLARVAQNRMTADNLKVLDAIQKKTLHGEGGNNTAAGFPQELERTGRRIADTAWPFWNQTAVYAEQKQSA